MKFTIKVPPRTKKNSMQVIYCKGHPMIIPSKAYKDYEKAADKYMPILEEPIHYPVNIKAIYYMPTHRRVDITNLHEALCDILVHYQVLADDHSGIVAAMDGSRVGYDKENPRTEVEITIFQG